jgi:hypothetical protein
MIRATRECAKEVLPEHSGPVTSLIAPTGNPPFRMASSASIPEETTDRTIFATGVRAEGAHPGRCFPHCGSDYVHPPDVLETHGKTYRQRAYQNSVLPCSPPRDSHRLIALSVLRVA